jgi:hypothetical protein
VKKRAALFYYALVPPGNTCLKNETKASLPGNNFFPIRVHSRFAFSDPPKPKTFSTANDANKRQQKEKGRVGFTGT